MRSNVLTEKRSNNASEFEAKSKARGVFRVNKSDQWSSPLTNSQEKIINEVKRMVDDDKLDTKIELIDGKVPIPLILKFMEG